MMSTIPSPWRYDTGALHPDISAQLAAVMEMTDRDGYEEPVEGISAGGPTDQDSLSTTERPEPPAPRARKLAK